MFANAAMKADQTQRFFSAIKRDKTKYKALSDKFKIEVLENPVDVAGYPCKTAEVIGNDKKTFPLSKLASMRDFSHEFTGPLKAETLGNWAIFYSGFGKREF